MDSQLGDRVLLRRQFLNQCSRGLVPFECRLRHDDLGYSAHGCLPTSTRAIFQCLSLAIGGLPASDRSYADNQVSGDMCLGHPTIGHPNCAVAGRQRELYHH